MVLDGHGMAWAWCRWCREQEAGAAAEPGPPDAEAARVATVLCVIPSPALLILGHQGPLALAGDNPSLMF